MRNESVLHHNIIIGYSAPSPLNANTFTLSFSSHRFNYSQKQVTERPLDPHHPCRILVYLSLYMLREPLGLSRAEH